jgi:hypothetical protein
MADVTTAGTTETGTAAGTMDRANIRVQKLKLADDGRPGPWRQWATTARL